jgi:hypothetical protein
MSGSGTVACPVPQPISTSLSPGESRASRTRSSNSAPGHTGRVRSYAAASASNPPRSSKPPSGTGEYAASSTSPVLAR